MKVWFLILPAGATLLAGCGQMASPENPAIEIRGEPIRRAASKNPPVAAAETIAPKTEPRDSRGEADLAGYAAAGFDKLSGYAFEVSDDLLGPVTNEFAAAEVLLKTDARIPPAVHALNNKRVAIQGFMLPL